MLDAKPVTLIIIGAAAGALAYWIKSQQSAGDSSADLVTAGDDESNIFLDSVDGVSSMFSNWPNGSGPYQDTITQAATSNGVPVEVLAWLLWKESRYNPDIISGAKRSRVGAMGIAQFMPATARDILGSEAAALDPERAIPGAARYLRGLYRQTGTWAQALAAYNWGIGNVLRKGIDAAPAETRDYYTTILAKANIDGGVYA